MSKTINPPKYWLITDLSKQDAVPALLARGDWRIEYMAAGHLVEPLWSEPRTAGMYAASVRLALEAAESALAEADHWDRDMARLEDALGLVRAELAKGAPVPVTPIAYIPSRPPGGVLDWQQCRVKPTRYFDTPVFTRPPAAGEPAPAAPEPVYRVPEKKLQVDSDAFVAKTNHMHLPQVTYRHIDNKEK